ncbi:sensor histidine kinase [Hamadaea tsunoensis]|uniref:sensor histidine kinase n=1 Tax=Hamadaea tsunoensis TaxID=53368 RepID=UPI0003F88F21|nr:sensor histidine kinase [Hamadaea tsunoensis]
MDTVFGRIGRDTRYVMVSLPLATASFVVLVTGLCLGLGTVPLGVCGALFATLLLARVFAGVERRNLAELGGAPVVPPRYAPPPPGAGWLRRLWHPVTQARYWLDVLHGIVIFPFSIAAFVVVVTWWAVAIFGLAYPVLGWFVSGIPGYQAVPAALHLGDGYGVHLAFNVALGLLAAATLPLVVRAAAATRGQLSRLLLAEPAWLNGERRDRADARTRARLADLTGSLADVRRQIDLAHLAAPATARRPGKPGTWEPPAAALTVLADLGLQQALVALAEAAPVPVRLEIGVLCRYSGPVEQAVYDLIAEALINIDRHSQASQVVVSLRDEHGVLVPLIADDGVGGARAAIGHSLTFVAARLRELGGELFVHSPSGGPTVVGAHVPIAG